LPKQFLSLTKDGKTMIQLTVERILPLVDIADIYIATNERYKKLVAEQLPQISEENILCEPVGRNTAPCIGLGAVHMAERYGDAVMLVLPSDHLIRYNALFLGALEDAGRIAECGSNLVTLGITPHYPETGYGYIRFLPDKRCGAGFAAERFVEKPDMATAKQYLATGEYLWNSGMFIWKVSTILNIMEQYLPHTYEGLCHIRRALGTEQAQQVLADAFPGLESVSIDCGVLEKADNIYTVPGSFGWDDVGAWPAVARIRQTDPQGSAIRGNVITVDTENCIIQGEDRLIAAVGLQELIIVDSKDALLVCQKNDAGKIKQLLEKLRLNNMEQYL